MTKYKFLKEESYEANMQLPGLGLVLYTFGNVSAVDRAEGVFAIKPSGVPYPDLKADDMVIVDFDANIVDGKLRPSSDTRTHAVLYKEWQSIGGIVHTHSTYATGWAQAGKNIPIMGTTHADHLPTDIPCAPVMSDEMIKGDYERETGFQILNHFRSENLDPSDVPMMIIANHGPFAWGNSVSKAVYNAATMEEIAKMAWITLGINPAAERLKPTLIAKHFERKHGKDAYYGQ